MQAKTTWLAFVLLLSVATGCRKSDQKIIQPKLTGKEIISFSFKAGNNPGQLVNDVVCEIADTVITATIPFAAAKNALVASFTLAKGAKATVADIVQASDTTANDYTKSVRFKVLAEDNTVKEYIIQFAYQPTGLPVIYINTENNEPVISKDDYLKATLKIVSNNPAIPDYEGTTSIKGRGNGTWDMPKKPYRLKLDTKESLLGMPADKDWALLANYWDKSLMRNYVAFETSKMFGMPYTPRSAFAEVIFNGEYAGNFQLTEHVKVAKNRVNIAELEEEDIDDSKITGGYFMEADFRLDEVNWFRNTNGVPFTIKDPDYGIPAQNDYIHNYVQHTEDVMFSNYFADPDSGYAAYLNPETFINWYWVNELFKNNDAIFWSSVFLYKDRDSLLKLGPVWDFDAGGGNIDYNDVDNPEGWWVKTSNWMTRLMSDPNFKNKAMARWTEIRNDLNRLPVIIDSTTNVLKLSQAQNFKRWDVLPVVMFTGEPIPGTFEGETARLKEWLTKRMTWIDNNLSTIAD